MERDRTRARTYDEMVDALTTEGLPALQEQLSWLTSADWERSTLLQPPEPDKAAVDVLQSAAHFDVVHGPDHGPGGLEPVVA